MAEDKNVTHKLKKLGTNTQMIKFAEGKSQVTVQRVVY